MKLARLPGTIRHEVQILVDRSDDKRDERHRYLDEIVARYEGGVCRERKGLRES